MKIRTIFNTLFISHVAVAGFAILSLSIVFYFFMSSAVIERTQNQLSSVNILKKTHIEEYFKQIERELLAQVKRINETPYAHLKSELELIQDTYDFRSILVVDALDRPILSIPSDSLSNQLLKNLVNLKKAQQRFQIIGQSEKSALSSSQLVYVLPLLRNGSGELTLFILEDFSKIQKILNERTGMGSTGESYLVAMDKKMRSESRFIQRKKPIEITVATEATKHVFDGKDSTGIINDYRGVKVVSVYRKINTLYLDFAIISEIDFEEAMAPVGRMRNYIVAIALLTLAIVVVLTVFISTSISKPILKLKDRIELLALGKIPALETKRPGVKEVSQISVAIDRLIFGYQQTANFADKIGSGYFTASFDTLSEFDVIGKSLIQMRDKLRELSEQQIKLSREKASALLQGQENERKRIVQDLHDGVGQHLTGIRLQVQALDDGKLKQALSLLIDETIKEVKQVSYDIMPSVLLDFGLNAALNGLCEHIKKYSSIYIDFTYVKEIEKNLPFEISIAVFRIVQEAFNNILKHADATKIDFYVRKSETELYLFVEDNGKGFDATLSATGGLGLQSMTERTKLLNGIIEINSNVAVGTSIEVTIPVRI